MKTHEAHPEYVLEIYGEGEYKDKLEDYIKHNGIEQSVFLKGFCDDIVSLMHGSRIYVSSSDWEGISNSLAEAMACGMTVVATDCPMGGSAMLICNGENGILTPVGDCDALTDAIERLMEDEAFGATMSEQASLLKNELAVKNIAAKWEALFI